jgi:hypothetical protein
MEEARWLKGSAPDYNATVSGSNMASPQPVANYVIFQVGCRLEKHSIVVSIF